MATGVASSNAFALNGIHNQPHTDPHISIGTAPEASSQASPSPSAGVVTEGAFPWPAIEVNPDVPEVPEIPEDAVIIVEHPDGSADVGIDTSKLPKIPVARNARQARLVHDAESAASEALRQEQAQIFRATVLRKRRIVFMAILVADGLFFGATLLYQLLTGGLNGMRRKGLTLKSESGWQWWLDPKSLTLEEMALSLIVDLIGLAAGLQDKTYMLGLFMILQAIATVLISLRGFSLFLLMRLAELVAAAMLRSAVFRYLKLVLPEGDFAQLESMFIGFWSYVTTMTGFCAILCGRDNGVPTLIPTTTPPGHIHTVDMSASGVTTARQQHPPGGASRTGRTGSSSPLEPTAAAAGRTTTGVGRRITSPAEAELQTWPAAVRSPDIGAAGVGFVHAGSVPGDVRGNTGVGGGSDPSEVVASASSPELSTLTAQQLRQLHRQILLTLYRQRLRQFQMGRQNSQQLQQQQQQPPPAALTQLGSDPEARRGPGQQPEGHTLQSRAAILNGQDQLRTQIQLLHQQLTNLLQRQPRIQQPVQRPQPPQQQQQVDVSASNTPSAGQQLQQEANVAMGTMTLNTISAGLDISPQAPGGISGDAAVPRTASGSRWAQDQHSQQQLQLLQPQTAAGAEGSAQEPVQPSAQAAAQGGAEDVVVVGLAAAAPTAPEPALVVAAVTTAAASVSGSTRRVSTWRNTPQSPWGRAVAQLHDLHRALFRRTIFPPSPRPTQTPTLAPLVQSGSPTASQEGMESRQADGLTSAGVTTRTGLAASVSPAPAFDSQLSTPLRHLRPHPGAPHEVVLGGVSYSGVRNNPVYSSEEIPPASPIAGAAERPAFGSSSDVSTAPLAQGSVPSSQPLEEVASPAKMPPDVTWGGGGPRPVGVGADAPSASASASVTALPALPVGAVALPYSHSPVHPTSSAMSSSTQPQSQSQSPSPLERREIQQRVQRLLRQNEMLLSGELQPRQGAAGAGEAGSCFKGCTRDSNEHRKGLADAAAKLAGLQTAIRETQMLMQQLNRAPLSPRPDAPATDTVSPSQQRFPERPVSQGPQQQQQQQCQVVQREVRGAVMTAAAESRPVAGDVWGGVAEVARAAAAAFNHVAARPPKGGTPSSAAAQAPSSSSASGVSTLHLPSPHSAVAVGSANPGLDSALAAAPTSMTTSTSNCACSVGEAVGKASGKAVGVAEVHQLSAAALREEISGDVGGDVGGGGGDDKRGVSSRRSLLQIASHPITIQVQHPRAAAADEWVAGRMAAWMQRAEVEAEKGPLGVAWGPGREEKTAAGVGVGGSVNTMGSVGWSTTAPTRSSLGCITPAQSLQHQHQHQQHVQMQDVSAPHVVRQYPVVGTCRPAAAASERYGAGHAGDCSTFRFPSLPGTELSSAGCLRSMSLLEQLSPDRR
ncbi:hypothetical protein VaNZ11_014822 [Volvox africanus]|uniref:Uncharacterized protein n=1 Tax=Volvox africanus TaxID=51714 RepID=A0ABQ5SJA2_9CHLO|nr:hypothetical protein VaNZ11_014822 [Volvox africanus]